MKDGNFQKRRNRKYYDETEPKRKSKESSGEESKGVSKEKDLIRVKDLDLTHTLPSAYGRKREEE